MEREKVITLLRLVKENGLKLDIAADEICSLFNVVGRSEQLKAFREWTRENLNQEDVVPQKAVDGYLESL